ncbi:hypothetical protein TNCV_3581991 [Trichonephila clavipes]|nr:hypothetical protein TNCV_3581991 [Trichonephila clavipes]
MYKNTLKEDLIRVVEDLDVLCKKVNGAMKTSSVEFISRSPTPSPMKKTSSVCVARKSLSPGSGNRGKREIVLNRRPEI